jgi:glycosyltransferase involved in cell wall biosynthesis
MLELKLGSQVRFLGHVPDADLRALYRLSQFLVLPTLYEADSNPIHEAWFEGVPVASSNVTALPDQVKDAGLLFNPRDVRAIADAMARLATDEALREELHQRGRRRMQDFSWERTAKAYRAVYRRAADFPLTEEDCWLLQWDWMREPQRTFPPNLHNLLKQSHAESHETSFMKSLLEN